MMAKGKKMRPPKNWGKKPVATCKRCVLGGLEQIEDASDGRPRFRCTRCKEIVTYSKSGGPIIEDLERRKKRS